MADEIRVMNGNQFHDTFKEMYDRYQDALVRRQIRRTPLKKDPVPATDFPGFHYTKWKNIETFYREDDWDAKAKYFCYLRDGELLGVNKVYIEPAATHFNNEWRKNNGLAPINGNWWGHAFVDVRESNQKQGIGYKLFDKMLSMMKPGDIFSSDMYSDKGLPFIRAWVASRSSKIHVLDEGYTAADYDPTKVNFTLGEAFLRNRVANRYIRSILRS